MWIYEYMQEWTDTHTTSILIRNSLYLNKIRLLHSFKVIITCMEDYLPNTSVGFSVDAVGKDLCTIKLKYIENSKFHVHL